MKRALFILASAAVLFQTTVFAAPIGIPGATVGANKSRVGAEVYLLFDRDLDPIGIGDLPGDEVESHQVIVKGEVGLNNRVDLNVRLGFGDFEASNVENPPEAIDTDTGPVFGVGFKVTWADIPGANLKIGTVAQTLRLRGEQGNLRHSLTEYDLAIGVFLDPPKGPPKQQKEIILLPYGGLAWSGLDVNGDTREEDVFGIFVGLALKIGNKMHANIELRIPEQTALTVSAAYNF
ncbi:MAG: hypothetical protein ACE5HN_05700 [Nitrospiria bacterium]